jgi:hypothetical protein
VKLAAASAALVLALYLPYGVFPDWVVFRFLMPACRSAFAALGRVSGRGARPAAAPARGVVLLASLTLLVSFNVTQATRQSAYALRDYEARYRTVGLYLAASLPPDAVIVTSQESGSAHHYAGLPILRWDLLAVDLDTAIVRLRLLGRHPILVVEDWEKPVLRERFPTGPLASLDWPPRADAGRTTRVGRVGSRRPWRRAVVDRHGPSALGLGCLRSSAYCQQPLQLVARRRGLRLQPHRRLGYGNRLGDLSLQRVSQRQVPVRVAVARVDLHHAAAGAQSPRPIAGAARESAPG